MFVSRRQGSRWALRSMRSAPRWMEKQNCVFRRGAHPDAQPLGRWSILSLSSVPMVGDGINPTRGCSGEKGSVL